MPEVVVTKPREGKFNKNAARRVRVAGKIPAVLYGAGHDAVAVEVDPKQISRILFSETGHNTIFDVEVAGRQPPAKAMIVDWQREPIKDQLIHIDLKRIALDKALRVSVRVKLLGIPVGVKTEGGILDQVLREVEIECLPADIPEPHRRGCERSGDARRAARQRSAALRQDQVPECTKTRPLPTSFRSAKKWLRLPPRAKWLQLAKPALHRPSPKWPRRARPSAAAAEGAAKTPAAGAKK